MRYTFPSVAAIPAGLWRWPHVSPAKEWACRGTGTILIDTDTLDRFELLRSLCGWPLIINSGYRSPVYNAAVSATGLTGPHTTGRACDIRIYGERAYKLIEIATTIGYTGIGVNQKGAVPGRYLHLDDLPLGDALLPRPAIWSY